MRPLAPLGKPDAQLEPQQMRRFFADAQNDSVKEKKPSATCVVQASLAVTKASKDSATRLG